MRPFYSPSPDDPLCCRHQISTVDQRACLIKILAVAILECNVVHILNINELLVQVLFH